MLAAGVVSVAACSAVPAYGAPAYGGPAFDATPDDATVTDAARDNGVPDGPIAAYGGPPDSGLDDASPADASDGG